MVGPSKAEKVKPQPYDPSELLRGWRILRQRMDLVIDPKAQRLLGRATVVVAALSTQCTSISLHSRRCLISSVTVNGQPASHILTDPLDNAELLVSVSSESTRRRVDDLQAEQERLASAPVPEELQVFIPPTVSADIVDALAAMDSTDAVAAAAAVAGSAPLPPPSCSFADLPKLTLGVEYCSLERTGGAVYYSEPAHAVVSGRFGLARCWMPCVDTLNWCDRCPWDLIISAPADQMVIASGDLLETRILLDDDTDRESISLQPRLNANVDAKFHIVDTLFPGPRKQFTYVLESATHASEIAFAAGPFIPLADPETPTSVSHFSLPGRAAELVHTALPVFSQIRSFCNEYFNTQLPSSFFKQVFFGNGESCVAPHTAGGGLVLYPGNLLHDERCIDEGFEARTAISSAVVSDYIGVLIRPRSSEDAWFVAGLAAHVSSLALAAIFGKNWYRTHIMDQVHSMAQDPRSKSPVLADVAKDQLFSIDKASAAVCRRAHIIAYIIERRIGADILRRALRDVAAETLRACQVGNVHDEAYLGLRVGPFLKRIRAICGTDVRNLVRSWAASCGTPRIRFGYRYNPRRHQVEFAVEQKGVNGDILDNDREGLLFQGSLCVRVMEPEGPSDHTVEIIDPWFVAELPCHSRRTKQKAVSQADKDGPDDSFRLSPISWVRIDPEIDWCIESTFIQSDVAWAAMLDGERDAVAQCNACRELGDYGTAFATKSLRDALMNRELYWRVRAAAAESLSRSEGGLDVLITYFRQTYAESGNESIAMEGPTKCDSEIGALMPNDFTDIAEYMVRRAVVKAVAAARGPGDTKNDVPPAVPKFIVTLLSENDNSKNAFDDDHYVADLLHAAKDVAISCLYDGLGTTERILEQINRYKTIDQLVPSRSGAVAAALVRALAGIEVAKLQQSSDSSKDGAVIQKLLLGRLLPNFDVTRLILELSSPTIPCRARIAAFSALAWLYGGDLETVHWLLARVDRSGNGDELISVPLRKESNYDRAFIETGSVRRGILEALCGFQGMSGWESTFPLFIALRRNTKRARQICLRILKLAVGDCDERIRYLAMKFALIVWGRGVPVCLLADGEYDQFAVLKKTARPRANSSSLKDSSPRPTSQLNGFARSIKTSGRHGQETIKTEVKKPGVPLSNGTSKSPRRTPAALGHAVKTAEPRPAGVTRRLSPAIHRDGTEPSKKDLVAPRPVLGVPMSAKPPSLVTLSKPNDPTMLEEDVQYLKRAWREHNLHEKRRQKSGNRNVESHALNQQTSVPLRDTKHVDNRTEPVPVNAQELLPSLHQSQSSGREHGLSKGVIGPALGLEDDEERKRRKERKKKKKKKRRREGDAENSGDDDESRGHRKKKKKKRSRDGHENYTGGGGTFSSSFGPALTLPVPSSEGSARSGGDGKLGVIKIKLGGTQMTSPFPHSG